MPRIQPVDHQESSGAQRELLDAVKKQMGRVPNLMATFAHAPAALRAYLDVREALAAGILPARLREQIALLVAQQNECEYCLAAHSAVGKSLGLSQDEILDSRRGLLDDAQATAALQFARAVVEKRGWDQGPRILHRYAGPYAGRRDPGLSGGLPDRWHHHDNLVAGRKPGNGGPIRSKERHRTAPFRTQGGRSGRPR